MRTRHPQGLVATIGSMIVWAVWFALAYALAAIGACARRGYATWRSADLDTGRGVELQQRARFMGRLSQPALPAGACSRAR